MAGRDPREGSARAVPAPLDPPAPPHLGWRLETFRRGEWQFHALVSGPGCSQDVVAFLSAAVAGSPRGLQFYADDPGTDGQPPAPVTVTSEGSRDDG